MNRQNWVLKAFVALTLGAVLSALTWAQWIPYNQKQQLLQSLDEFRFYPTTAKVIASDTIALPQSGVLLTITGQGGVDDDLSIITGGVSGDMIWIRPGSTSQTITLKHATAGTPAGGNVTTPGATDYAIPDYGYVQLQFNGESWISVCPAVAGVAGLGDFIGPSSSTDRAAVIFNGTGGKTGQNSALRVDSAGGLIVPEITSPTATAATYHELYFKNDSRLYSMHATGSESTVLYEFSSAETPWFARLGLGVTPSATDILSVVSASGTEPAIRAADSVGPARLTLQNTQASASGRQAGILALSANNSNETETQYVFLEGKTVTTTLGAEDGILNCYVTRNGSNKIYLALSGAAAEDRAIARYGLKVGDAGTDGLLTIYSEQGTTDYTWGLQTNATMTASFTESMAAALPGGAAFDKCDATGTHTWDTTLYGVPSGTLTDNYVLVGAGTVGMKTATAPATMESSLTIDQPGASVNSPTLTLRGDSSGNAEDATLQLLYGADPYLRISVTDDGTTPALVNVLDIHDTVLAFANDNTVDIGTSGANRPKSLYLSGGVYAEGGAIQAGATATAGTFTAMDAGTLVFNDDGNNTTVTFGPVGDGTTILGVTGTINATGLQVGGVAVLTAESDTLASVTARGETATANLVLPASGTLKFTSGAYLGTLGETTLSAARTRTWPDASGTVLITATAAPAQGDVLYFNGSSQWVSLGAGTSGQVLQTGGVGANPSWVDASAGGGGVLQGEGALVYNLYPTDDGPVTSNARGESSVDFQVTRSAATQVASGAGAALIAGANNTASGADSFVGTGTGNISSGARSATVSGENNTSSGVCSFVGSGSGNQSGGNYTVAPGGQGNICNGTSSWSPGGTFGLATHWASGAWASGRFGSTGDTQSIVLSFFGATTNATQTELALDNSVNYFTVASGDAYSFHAYVFGVDLGTGAAGAAGDRYYYELNGTIANIAGTTALLPDPVIQLVVYETDATFDATIVADTANDRLALKVTGAADKNVRWRCRLNAEKIDFTP